MRDISGFDVIAYLRLRLHEYIWHLNQALLKVSWHLYKDGDEGRKRDRDQTGFKISV